MGFEPTRAKHIGLAVQRLNHSATSSHNSRTVIHEVNIVDHATVHRRLHNAIHRIKHYKC